MTAGYAAFQTNLKIKGTSGISSNWDIKITNVTKSNTSGGAEEVKAPTWTDLTAYMEANLYEEGDSIEYDVTVQNNGTIDASLDNISENIKSTNEAVKITFSGYTKGEKLFKNSSQIIKVKIEYNPDFTGTLEEGSGEISVDLNYTQAEGGTITPTDKYLVTYDCVANGGKDCTNFNEYLAEGESVNLNYKGDKKGYLFIGWNTSKDATEGLTELNMLNENITLYAIYKIEPEPTITLSTTKTTNSITVVTNAYAESGISKYEYSINGGEWIVGDHNIYTFTKLNKNTEYLIKVKIITNSGKVVETNAISIKTDELSPPTYTATPDNELYNHEAIVTVTSHCSYCTNEYSIDEGKTWKVFPSDEFQIKFLSNGNVLAKTSDSVNTISSSYTITNIDPTPSGTIKIHSSSAVPEGYLLCDGRAVSRTTYSELFKVIGTTYGSGDGSTTFNIPNLQGKVPVGKNSGTFNTLGKTGGEEEHTLTIAEIPAHTHGNKTLTGHVSNISHALSTGILNTSGIFKARSTNEYLVYSTDSNQGTYDGFYIDLTHEHSSVGENKKHNNLQPYITINYIIRY